MSMGSSERLPAVHTQSRPRGSASLRLRARRDLDRAEHLDLAAVDGRSGGDLQL